MKWSLDTQIAINAVAETIVTSMPTNRIIALVVARMEKEMLDPDCAPSTDRYKIAQDTKTILTTCLRYRNTQQSDTGSKSSS